MPVPKRKSSRMRSRKRRTHYKYKVPAYVECPNCGSPMLPHRVCLSCGYYEKAKRPVVVVKSKTE